jgi:hypothetical protein
MRLAVVAGGWHWPAHFFRAVAGEVSGADLFVIAHRSPELPIVREEKRDILDRAIGPLAEVDRELYAAYPDVAELRFIGWNYSEAPNTIGDWGFFNQWLERHDFRQYDVILNCHDDTFIQRPGVFDQLNGDWLLLANGRYPEAPDAYVRGSFEFWKPELLELLGGRIDLGNVTLTREGKTDTPRGLGALSEWNNTGVPMRDFLCRRGLIGRVSYLSEHYRISPWVIEAERGFLHFQDGAPWSFEAGLKEHIRPGSMAASHREGVAEGVCE